MTDRREFLRALAAAGLSAPVKRLRDAAPRVEAAASVFYAHPAAENTLVRFSVFDAEESAGRIRVFESSGRRLLGTAAVLGVGGTLFGELWLPLRGETQLISQLEMPGLRRPLRTPHRIVLQPQWTLHWITVADPDQVRHHLRSLPVWRRAAAVALLRAFRVTGNPFAESKTPPGASDHLPLLRRGMPALQLENEFGIPISPVAVVDPSDLAIPGTMLGLTGGGFSLVATRTPARAALTTRRALDGSTVYTLALPPGSSPVDLGFANGRDVMAREIERWLKQSRDPRLTTNSAMLVSTTVDDDLPQMSQAVTDWNSRYAFPRIVVGNAEAYFEGERTGGSGTAPAIAIPVPHRTSPTHEEILRASHRRAAERAGRVAQMLAPINELLGSAAPGVAGLAQYVEAPTNGTLVLNPSPIPRTDSVTMPDGTEQMATDVPGLGYAYLPTRTASVSRPFIQLGPPSAFGHLFTVRLDPETGAVSSLYHRADDREWVRAGTAGLNAVRGATLENLTRMRLPGIGMRLIARRRTAWGPLTSTVTAYETEPWIDITNEFEDENAENIQVDFHFAVDDPQIAWETPAGFDEASGPLGPIAHLRWLRLLSRDNWQVLFRGLDAPYAACDANGQIVSLSPPGRSRYRIKVSSPYAPPDEPWHFGWSAEPFVVTPVEAATTASSPLPRYGHLIGVDQPGVAAIAIKPADNGDGAIAYLQELIGAERTVRLTAGILGFRGARRVDVLERHLGVLFVGSEPAVDVLLPAHGIGVVRLLDLYLRRG